MLRLTPESPWMVVGAIEVSLSLALLVWHNPSPAWIMAVEFFGVVFAALDMLEVLQQ